MNFEQNMQVPDPKLSSPARNVHVMHDSRYVSVPQSVQPQQQAFDAMQRVEREKQEA